MFVHSIELLLSNKASLGLFIARLFKITNTKMYSEIRRYKS